MKLMREPRAFNLHTSRHIMRLMGRSDDKWRKYLVLLSYQPQLSAFRSTWHLAASDSISRG